MSLILASTLLLLQPTAAPAAEPATAPAEERASDLDRIVCRKRPVTGSRTDFIRECRTAREWNARREAHARGMREFTNSASSNGRPSITPGSE